MKIVLASASPRRRELMKQAGFDFEICVSDCPEHTAETTPDRVVLDLSGQKALDVARRYDDGTVIIAADTVVACDGRILGKPSSEEEALTMLRLLQGRSHQVYTGVTILTGLPGARHMAQLARCTQVEMFPASDQVLLDYIATGEPIDKAGAYGIQGRAAVLIRGIRGDYNNVVGLPIADIWQYFHGETKEWTDASL